MSYNKWLKNVGYGPLPSRQEYDPHQVYVTSIWTVPESFRERVAAILPYGLETLHKYATAPDWSTTENRTMLISVYERNQSELDQLYGRFPGQILGHLNSHDCQRWMRGRTFSTSPQHRRTSSMRQESIQVREHSTLGVPAIRPSGGARRRVQALVHRRRNRQDVFYRISESSARQPP